MPFVAENSFTNSFANDNQNKDRSENTTLLMDLFKFVARAPIISLIAERSTIVLFVFYVFAECLFISQLKK